MTFLLRPLLSLSLLCALGLVACSSTPEPAATSTATPETEVAEIEVTETSTPAIPEPEIATQTLEFADGAVTVEVPAAWEPNPGQHPFDEQYVATDKRLGTGIRALTAADLAEGQGPKDIYLRDIEVLTAQGGFFETEPEAVETLDDKTITTSTYVGEINGLDVYYKFVLIEFTANPDIFLTMIQGGAPEDWDQANETLMKINRSATLLVSTYSYFS